MKDELIMKTYSRILEIIKEPHDEFHGDIYSKIAAIEACIDKYRYDTE